MREIRIFVLCILVLAFGIWLTSPVMAQSISITADRDIIYFGDIITFSGSNSESDTVYLYVTGPNLPWQGGLLTDPRTPINPYVAPLQFTVSEVQDDNTWEYNWQTSNLNIDAGTYTIYAVTTPSDTDQLSETQYDTESVVFIADNRIYPQMPDNTAEEDISTDGQPQIPKSDDKISITANRDLGYLGNEIKLSGTNFDTNETYLFITGPNLPSNGGALTDPKSPICSSPNCYYREFTVTDVNADKTWEYKWQTANLNIDPSTYTIYAVTTSNDKNNLTNAHYATVSVTLRKPYLNAHVSDDVIEQNESLYIRGVAEGDPSQGVAFWIMGRNFVSFNTEAVNDDGTFEYELDEYTTAGMSQGQYFVVVQHPMYNDELDVYPRGDGGYIYRYVFGSYPIANSVLFTLEGPGSPPTSSVLNALLFNLNNPNIDDRYVRLSFTIEEPSPPQLTEDYLSATIVSYGGEVIVQGNSKGNPVKGVAIWVIGDDSVNYQVIPVNPNLTYVYKMPTSYLTDGEYAVIVQHPMYNNGFDVYPSADKKFVLGPYPLAGSILFNLQELNSVSHTLATDALVNNLENPNIDDIFIQSKFSVGTGSPPFVEEDKLSVSVQPSTINQGEIVRITGNAKSNPSEGVAIWILGQNYVSYNIASVNGDSFEYEMTGDITRNLSNGKYSVIVQHPMYNDDLDIYPRSDGGYGYRYVVGPYPTTDSVLLILEGPGSLNSDSALNALLNALNNPNVDDQYELVDFGVGTSIEPIQNPTIISLNPSSISKGNEGFTLEVIGANFVDGARVFWEGQERATDFISSIKVTADVLKADVDTAGTYKVKVKNPDGSVSNEVTFTATEDTPISYPKVDTFTITPLSGPVGQRFTISGDVSAGEGATIQRVELWRNSGDLLNQDDWTKINQSVSLQGLTQGSYFFENTPDSSGDYWYGIHIVDSNTWAHEGGGNDLNDGKPIKVIVYESSPSESPKLVTDKGQFGRTTATLRGHIENPDPGQTYPVCFRYEGGSITKTKGGYSTVSESNPNFEYQLTNLVPGTTYYYRAIHRDSEGLSNPNDIDANNSESFTTISAKIDPQVVAYLDSLIPDENSQYFSKSWKISPEQYKLMILTIAWAEGGEYEFSAHSGAPSDRVVHPDVQFYFSSGIGPFQLTRGGLDHWENWSTISKLRWEDALQSTLKNHKSVMDGKTIGNLEDMRKAVRDTWFAYYKSNEHTPEWGHWEVDWKQFTGTEWDSVKDSNKDSNSLLTNSEQTYSNICDSIKINWKLYSEVVRPLNKLHWDVRTTDNLMNWDGKTIQYNQDLDSWLIQAYGVGFSQMYLYGLDEKNHTEIWAYYNKNDKAHHLKSIFVRDYRAGDNKYALPISKNDITLSHDVVKISKEATAYYILYCPVDAILTDPDGLIISKDTCEVPNAQYERRDINGDGDSDILITIYNPKIGNYSIEAIPFQDADPNDAFSIYLINDIYTSDNPLILADNVSIANIPTSPYVYYSYPLSEQLNYPGSITGLQNTTYLPDSITWAWIDPASTDFDYVMVFLDGIFHTNVTAGVQQFTVNGLSPATEYSIGTRTVGTNGFVNTTWVNQTTKTAAASGPDVITPEANFIANVTFAKAPLVVQFTDQSLGYPISSWTWDFGDGANSTEQNPVHTYTNYGIYNVSLTVTNAAGEDTIIKNDFIQVIPMVGGDTGYYLIHCNVEGAEVYFDQDSKGVITDGTLLVKIYLTATPYHRYSVSKTGYVTINEALPSYPAKDQTKDIFVTLVKVTDDSWTRPPYPEVTKIQPGYPDTNWTRPPYPEVTKIQPGYPDTNWTRPSYPEVTKIQPGYPDTNWTRPSYPEVTKIQPGYPDTNWTRPSYLNWLWNRPSIKNFLKDIFG